MHFKGPLILLNLIFMYACILHAFPVSFDRLILRDEKGKLVKTVDLIGDAHLPVHELVKRPSRQKPLLLADAEKKIFTTAERTLLIALRELNKQPEKIDLLWEAVPKDLFNVELIKKFPFLAYGGFIAEKDFGQNQGSITFNNADSYRRMLGKNGIFMEAILIGYLSGGKMPHGEVDSEKLIFKIIDFKTDLEALVVIFSNIVDRIKKSSPTEYERIEQIWNEFKEAAEELLEKMINPALAKNPDTKSNEIFTNLTDDQKRMLFFTINQITNLEMLFKILASDASHIILYAGFFHTLLLNQLLEKTGFKLEISIKPFLVPPSWDFFVPLSHRTWQFLLESPQKSFKRYKEHQQRPLLFSEENRSKTFYTLFYKLNDPALKSIEAQNSFITELKSFLKNVNKHKIYLNFLETRKLDTWETLLFFAVKNDLVKIVEFLISKGARINSINKNGQTPLHYAAQLSEPTIFSLLVRHGGDTTIKDTDDKTSLDYASWKEQVQANHQKAPQDRPKSA